MKLLVNQKIKFNVFAQISLLGQLQIAISSIILQIKLLNYTFIANFFCRIQIYYSIKCCSVLSHPLAKNETCSKHMPVLNIFYFNRIIKYTNCILIRLPSDLIKYFCIKNYDY